MNEIEMYKKEMMDNGVDVSNEEAVRNYITKEIEKEGLPTVKQEALINSWMVHMGFGKDESEYTYHEIFKLRDMLNEAKIPFGMGKGVSGGYHIVYRGRFDFPNKVVCSVVETPSSYGIEDDLLEIQGLMTREEMIREQDDVLGYLTAEDVFNRIFNDFNQKNTEMDFLELLYNIKKLQEKSATTFYAILDLRDMLEDEGIPFEFRKHELGNGYHLEYKVNGRQIYSIIQTDFSYGAKEGKVEIMGNGIDAVPFDVEDAFRIIKEYHDSHK